MTSGPLRKTSSSAVERSVATGCLGSKAVTGQTQFYLRSCCELRFQSGPLRDSVFNATPPSSPCHYPDDTVKETSTSIRYDGGNTSRVHR
jgi:hypothetical protein